VENAGSVRRRGGFARLFTAARTQDPDGKNKIVIRVTS
jgi:hypothetical protein